MSLTCAPPKRLLSRIEVEDQYGLSKRYLEKAAARGDGPPMLRISKKLVKYDRDDLEDWLATRRVRSTSQHLNESVLRLAGEDDCYAR